MVSARGLLDIPDGSGSMRSMCEQREGQIRHHRTHRLDALRASGTGE